MSLVLAQRFRLGRTELGSSLSAFGVVLLGSFLSVLDFTSIWSALSVADRVDVWRQLSVNDLVKIGSEISVQRSAMLGQTLSVFGGAKFGSTISTEAVTKANARAFIEGEPEVHSSLSVLSSGYLASDFSVCDVVRLGRSLSVTGPGSFPFMDLCRRKRIC